VIENHPAPVEWTVEFGDGTVTTTDPVGGRSRSVKLQADDLVMDTLLALSWYVATTAEDQCELRLLQLLGRYLFEMIFPARDAARRERFRGDCANSAGVRLNLHFGRSAARYAQLPWEFLRIQTNDGSRFLSEMQAVTVTLTRFLPTQSQLHRCAPPIRVLLHVSSPDTMAEIHSEGLETVLERLRGEAAGKLKVLVRANAGWDQLSKDLKEFQPHVFHFSGHGERDGFWLGGSNRETQRQRFAEVGMSKQPFGFKAGMDPDLFKPTIEAICGLFREHKPQLVVLDACNSDWSWLSEMLPGVAHQLVSLVPAVIAMRYSISNKAAEKFAAELYKGVVAGQSLDFAVQAARNQLHPADSAWSSRAFGTPVLYLKGGEPLCDPLVTAQQRADTTAPATPGSLLARPCPRCQAPGVWSPEFRKCSQCKVPFRCPKCAFVFNEGQVARLRFCPDCEDGDFTDLPPVPDPGAGARSVIPMLGPAPRAGHGFEATG
jgi:hypothetical protein